MPLLTISHSVGCGAHETARTVARLLNVPFYDDGRLLEKAYEMKVCDENEACFQEKSPGLLERLFTNRPEVYLNLMQSVVYEVDRSTQGVIVGHGSCVLLSQFDCAFHVYLHGSDAKRTDTLVKRYAISHKEARSMMRRQDDELEGFFRYAFHRNIQDPRLYDLVLQMDKFDAPSAADIILKAAMSDTLRECGLQVVKSMEKMGLEMQLRAEIRRRGIRDGMLKFELTDEGEMHLSGMVPGEDEKQRLLDLLNSRPGGVKVNTNITVIKEEVE